MAVVTATDGLAFDVRLVVRYFNLQHFATVNAYQQFTFQGDRGKMRVGLFFRIFRKVFLLFTVLMQDQSLNKFCLSHLCLKMTNVAQYMQTKFWKQLVKWWSLINYRDHCLILNFKPQWSRRLPNIYASSAVVFATNQFQYLPTIIIKQYVPHLFHKSRVSQSYLKIP